MRTVLTNDHLTEAYLEWLGKQTRDRYLRAVEREEDMGKHSRPEDTDILYHRGYQCEACKGYWAALEPGGGDQPEEIPCLATEGCEGPVVALYPTDEPVPDWIPVIIQGGKVVIVFVLVKGESYDGSEVVGVFHTIEVAKTVAESDAPNRRFEWKEDGPGCWYVSPYDLSGSRHFYSIEQFEVRSQ